jgi:glycosyltransferase involved in cell wall biosynthesis
MDFNNFNSNFDKNKVSIIIPTYNRFKNLMKAIQSAKNQSYPYKEIITINDASTDQNYDLYDWTNQDLIYKKLNTNNRYLYNVGCANGITRNEGILISKGEYLAFLDDDDYYLDNKIMEQILLMKKYNYKFSSTNMFVGKGSYTKDLTKDIYFKNPQGLKIGENLYEFNYETIKNICYINLSSVIIHRDIIIEFGGFGLGVAEDYNYWKKIIHKFKCLYIHYPTIYYDLNHGDGKLYIE